MIELGPGYIFIGITLLIFIGATVALDEFKKK